MVFINFFSLTKPSAILIYFHPFFFTVPVYMVRQAFFRLYQRDLTRVVQAAGSLINPEAPPPKLPNVLAPAEAELRLARQQVQQNAAIAELLETGRITSTSVLTVAPEAETAAGDDISRADADQQRDDQRTEGGLHAVDKRLAEAFRIKQLGEVLAGE